VGIAMGVKSPKMMTQEVRYGVQLSHLIFPVDFRDLRFALAKNGYELSPVRELPPAPTRISFGGEIARKSETTIIADSEAGEIGVVGKSLQQAVACFGDLANVVAKLAALSNSDLARLKQTFIRHKHPRFLKVFSFNMPYGTGDAYRKHVEQADPSQLAHLVKICGFLMETKSYLFWKNLYKWLAF
jgi:hypothetical protein